LKIVVHREYDIYKWSGDSGVFCDHRYSWSWRENLHEHYISCNL